MQQAIHLTKPESRMHRRYHLLPWCLMAYALAAWPTLSGCASSSSPDSGASTELRADGAKLVFSASSPTASNASAQNPAFSPDGNQILFTRFANGYNEGPAELWIVNTDGTNPHRITPVEDQDNVNVPGSAWNAVTNEIVFASDREESDDLWAIHPDGSGMRRITTHPAPPFWIEPVWSPDGQWIVFEADSEAASELQQRGAIFKIRSDGTQLTQLTRRNGEDFDDRLPNWSPEGDQVLFQHRDPLLGDGDNWDIFVIDTEGDNPVNVSDAPGSFNTDNSWSPDGRWIASSSQFPADGQPLPHPNIIAFFVPDADGHVHAPVRITHSDQHEDGAASVSPDGQWGAFESHQTPDENSPSDIWIIPVPEAVLSGILSTSADDSVDGNA